MLVFRSHDTVPSTITSPTLQGLAEEWVAINANADHHRQVSQMRLPGCTRPGDVLDLIDRTDRETSNDILYRLVTSESYLAWRMALQAVLPRILGFAVGRRVYSGSLEDHLQELIGEVWEAIGSYPEHCRQHVALNITRRRHPVEGKDVRLVPADTDLRIPVADPDIDDSATELRLLIHAGLREGAVAPDDVELLTEIYIDGYSAAEAAERRSVSPAAIRKRCERTRTRLAAVGA